MPAVLAELNVHDILVIAVGIIVGLAAINTVHWLHRRRRRFRLPEEMLVEMSRFAERFQRAAEQMTALSHLMEDRTRQRWKSKNVEILKVLRQMNQLLEHFNDFFEEKIQNYERRPGEGPLPPNDFVGPEEERRFRSMKEITSEEIARADWDALLKRLQHPDKPPDRV